MEEQLIASLPRSGNHLVRFIVEYVTGRETLGIRSNDRDLPLRLSRFPLEPHVLAHVGGPAIGRKVHFSWEIRQEFRNGSYDGAIVVHRKVDEAAFSHMVKSAEYQAWQQSRGWERWRAYRTFVSACALYFTRCDKFYRAIKELPIPCVFVSYEKLISEQREEFLPELHKLQRALGAAVDEGRMCFLAENFPELRRISAGRVGGDWGGINSGFRASFYRTRMPLIVRLPLALHHGVARMRWLSAISPAQAKPQSA